jgi:hypothetical protein
VDDPHEELIKEVAQELLGEFWVMMKK